MSGNLKALGFLFSAALAISAFAAQTAMAEVEYFHSHKENTIVTGESLGTQTFSVAPGKEFVLCTGAKLAGTQAVGEKHVGEKLGTSYTFNSTTVHPEYFGGGAGSGCTLKGLEGASTIPVNTGSCHFKLAAETGVSKHGPASIECGTGAIEISFSIGGFNCVIKYPTQTTGAGGVSYESVKAGATGEWDLKAKFTLEGVSFTTNNGKGCMLIGIPKETKEAVIAGEFTLRGFEDREKTETGVYEEAAQTGIWHGKAE